MKRLFFFLTLLALPAMAHDYHSPYDNPDQIWRLIRLNGKPFPDMALLSFPNRGRIDGQAPCNRFFGTMWSSYPWFKAENIATTRMACPALKAETLFLQTLEKMTTAEATDSELSLSGDNGESMLFRPAASDE